MSHASTATHTCLHAQAAERLREKISGVEAAMQESHMQLSQRLSSTVQRVSACVRVYDGLGPPVIDDRSVLKTAHLD